MCRKPLCVLRHTRAVFMSRFEQVVLRWMVSFYYFFEYIPKFDFSTSD